MKGQVYLGKFELKLMDLDVPEPGPDEVLIKVAGCGVCGTDYHIYSGEVPFAKPPVVIGHEITGKVHMTGSNVDDLVEGQTVCLDPVIPCMRCHYCGIGRFNLCEDYRVMGYHMTGGFAEYTVAPRKQVYPISEGVGVKGGILAEPVACVINGFNRLGLLPGGRVLIMGAGPMGLIWTQILRSTPSVEIVQIDLVKMRTEASEDLGADRAICAQKDEFEPILREEYPEGFEYVIDVTGDPDAVAMGIRLTRKGGTMMIFGVCPEGSTMQVDPYEVYLKEMKIIGSKMPPFSLGRAVRLIESGRIDYDRIVSHLMPLEKLPEALDLFVNGKGKVLKMAILPG